MQGKKEGKSKTRAKRKENYVYKLEGGVAWTNLCHAAHKQERIVLITVNLLFGGGNSRVREMEGGNSKRREISCVGEKSKTRKKKKS